MLRQRPDGTVELDIQAVPRASKSAVGQPHGDRLKIHVKAPPVDGAANAAILDLLREVLAVPRSAIEILRGHTGKRKTVRVDGLDPAQIRERLGLPPESTGPTAAIVPPILAASLGLALTCACSDPRELPITVILPADSSDLEQADNASLLFRPGGDAYTFAVDGLDFTLELEDEPSDSLQQLELYLAKSDKLLAWGSTAAFTTAGAAPEGGIALFLGRPGRLSTWPDSLDAPDPAVLAATAVGRGMLLLESDGDTFLLNHFTLDLEAGASLSANALTADDGGLYSAADGRLIRLAFEQSDPRAWRYDPGTDRWDTLTVDAAADIGPRPEAAVLLDPDQTRLYLIGGGDHGDAIAIDLLADDDDRLGAATVADFALDRPRPGATALWLPASDDPTADVLVVGGGEIAGAPGLVAGTGEALGADLPPWQHPACALLRGPTLDDPAGADGNVVACLGGILDGEASDGVALIDVGGASFEYAPAALATALAEPLLFHDNFALYAQGANRTFRVDRVDQAITEVEGSALRARGGHSVSLATGATFLVGGVDQDDVPLDRWQVFIPAIEP
ncbi:MAG: DUF167 domain-containing protein [Myxococcales bacterium]|nr:DUF167 domain-containing protein [Myxococcales bacterium]